MNVERDTLIFLHIPKTAGSTFHTILNKKFSKRNIQNIFGARYTSPEVEAFVKRPKSEKATVKVLKGHMPFGLHRYLPGESFYIAFLRNPTEQVISAYYYIIKNDHNPHHEAVAVNGMSISEFVSSGISIATNNAQCRFLNGDIDVYDFNQCDESLYASVQANIAKHFLWLGITERFDESILVLTHLMGWQKPPHYFRGNSSKIRKKTSQIDPQEIKVIEQFNTYDARLYEYANKRLDDHIKNIPEFCDKLARYKKQNQRLQARWGWLPDSLRQLFV